MSLVIYKQARDLRGLKQTLGDAGYLDVTDESKYHAIAVPTYDDLTWRWRVWLPEGKRYSMVAVLNDLPLDFEKYQPTTKNAAVLGPDFSIDGQPGISGGERLVTVSLNAPSADRMLMTFALDNVYTEKLQIPANNGNSRGWPFQRWIVRCFDA